MKKTLLTLSITGLALWSIPVHAEDLIQAYQDALKSDPTLKAAEAEMLAAEQLAPISRGVFFPQVSTSGSIGGSQINQTISGASLPGGGVGTTNSKSDSRNTQLSLDASQIIFDYASWGRLQTSKAQVKQAKATYNAAQQDLMLRLATAYFSVLDSYDNLLATQAEKRSLAEQLRQTQEQFKVGLIAITGVDQVQASYDSVIAQEIAQKNDVSDQLEDLRAITGVFYTVLAGIKGEVPLIPPSPANINEWVKVAQKQNYTLIASKYATQASKENIKTQSAGHFPSIGATGSYSYNDQTSLPNFLGTKPTQTDRVATIALNAELPIFSGGTVTSETRQASYQYAQSSAETEQTYRNVLTQARTAYLGVISGISKIKADKQAIASNQSSLDATKAGYTVGTNTILDVLQQQSALYTAQSAFTTDQYAYLVNTLTLKQAAGTISEHDLSVMNTWLNKTINFSDYYFDVKDPVYTYEDVSLPKPRPAKNNVEKTYSETETTSESTTQATPDAEAQSNPVTETTPKTETQPQTETKTTSNDKTKSKAVLPPPTVKT